MRNIKRLLITGIVCLGLCGLLLTGCATRPEPVEKEPKSAEAAEQPDKAKIAKKRPEKLHGVFVPRAAITAWPKGRQAACSITFDDGTLDQYLLGFTELEKRGLKGTFFIITGFREEGYWQDGPARRALFSWDHTREIFQSGHEIASHSHTHADLSRETGRLTDELYLSLLAIQKEVPGTGLLTFGWPYWRSNDRALEEVRQYYLAARAGSASLDNYSAEPKRQDIWVGDEQYKITSIALLRDHDDMDWKTVCDKVYDEGGWLIVSFHGIDDGLIPREAIGWQALSLERYRTVLDYLQSKGFWIAPFGDVIRYIREKRNFFHYFQASSQDMIECVMDDGLNDADFYQEVSMGIEVPSTWKYVTVEKNGEWVPHTRQENWVYIDTVPNSEPVRIQTQTLPPNLLH